MAPPGRRKNFLHTYLPLLVLLFFSTTAHAISAVIGIDLGTEYIKAAVAKPGSPIEIVLTKDSKRKEAAALAFKPSRNQISDKNAFPERLYGGDALALTARFPTDVYQNLKTILGLPHGSQEVKTYLNRYPGLQEQVITRASDVSEGSTVGFKSQSFGKDGIFMVEELLAMELKNIKANAEAAVGKGSVVTDVVITYPAYYTVEEKRAIELAAELAGLRVLGLVSDGLAVGMNIATSRTFESVSEGGKPEYNIIYDMGAGSTTATVLKFQGRTIKGVGKRNQTIQEVQVLGAGSDRTFGGDTLNDLVVRDMITKFLGTPRMKPFGIPTISVRKHGKTMARLSKDAERVRQILSANSQASATLEGLYYEDVTFKYTLTREEFEQIAQDQAARVAAPLNQALSMSGLSLEEIDSVILHGGAIRTPFVQKQLESVVGGADKLKTNVNADEAAVMGAAFMAASISPAYRVKDIRGTDISGSAYTMSWSADGKPKEQKIFVQTSQIGVEKQVTIKAQQDTILDFKYEDANGMHDTVSFELTNITKSVNELADKYGCAPANISTVLTVRLHKSNGVPELASGSVSCFAEKAKEKDGSVMDNVKGMFGFGSKKDQAPLEVEDDEIADDPSATTPLPVSDPTSSGTVISAASDTEALSSTSSESASVTQSAKFKPTTVTIPLASKISVKGLNQPPVKELPNIKKRLSAFDKSDEDTIMRAEALNVLEAFTYRARDYLGDETFIAVTTDKVRGELEKQLSAVSDWLYGDGIDAKLEDFKAKLKSLKAIVEPALKRKDEGNKREAAVQGLEKSLTNASSMMEMIKGSIEQAAKAAASTVSSAASSVSDKVSSVISPSSSDGAELDDDPYAAEATSVVEDEVEPPPKLFEYSEDDLSSVTKAYDSAKAWLDEKLALQAKLGPYDDPAVLVADIERKGQELQRTVSDLVMKQIKGTKVPKSRKVKGPKSNKTKTKKGKNATASETTASSSATTTSVKDEL